MQESVTVEPGRRPGPPQQHQFAGVDLRRPKGFAAPAPVPVQEAAPALPAKLANEGGGGAGEGDPCPRCASRDTKFCYYNNYNTSQPRHFCKGCRRYWTKGGTLRNVPVGGGTRKKPSSTSSYAAAADVDNKPTKKKPASKKRRVVAPAPEPAVADASGPVPAKTTTTTTDGSSEITTETAAAAPLATVVEEDSDSDSDSLAHLLLQPGAEDAVALGLGLSDFPSGSGGKEEALLVEEDSFVWPPAYDLGTCWASAGFVDPDPTGLFLNLP